MNTLYLVLLLVGGLALLTFGADMFVRSASKIANYFGIPSIIIGLTVVAFGTSAPEFAVNIFAALKGNQDIALGNVIGSNIFNISIIIGLCAIVSPLKIHMQLLRLDIPLLLISSFVTLFMIHNLHLSTWEGAILLGVLLLYSFLQVKLALKESSSVKEEFKKEYQESGKPLTEGVLFFLGLALLVGGAQLFVDGAVAVAKIMGLSEQLIGLTIVAAGTSLPEVATSIAATLKGENDIAVGNVIGSNIFNLTGVLGVSALMVDLKASEHLATIDAGFMVFLTLFMLPLAFYKGVIGRKAGLFLVISWIGYTWYLLMA
jgi:cation:H+ antiporter